MSISHFSYLIYMLISFILNILNELTTAAFAVIVQYASPGGNSQSFNTK